MVDLELLKYWVESGIIDIAYLQNIVAMKKREEILKEHPYDIWQGKDGKWRTYLPDAEKGRKLVKRTDQKSIEDVVIKFIKDNSEENIPGVAEIQAASHAVNIIHTANICRLETVLRKTGRVYQHTFVQFLKNGIGQMGA